MSNYKQINISAETLQTKVGQIGTLSSLETDHKDNLVEAINEVIEADNEVVQVTIVPVTGTLSFTDKVITVAITGHTVTETFPLDANGHCYIMIPKDKGYTLTYPSFVGYSTPAAETFTATQNSRTIVKNYAISGELADMASGIVLEESSTPNWTKLGIIGAVDGILNADGSYVIDEVHKKYARLSASDDLKFADGSTWGGTYGNAFRHIVGCYYTHTTNSDNKRCLWLSRLGIGSGRFGEMWIGKYKGNVHDGKLWSQPELNATGNVTISQFWAYAQAQGEDYGLTNYFDQQYLVALHLAKFGTPAVETDTEASYGVAGNMGIGMQNAGSAYYNAKTGCTSGLGDGTGEAVYSGSVYQNKLFGIEGLTGQQWEFRPNIRKVNGSYQMVVYKGNQVSNTIGEGHADYLRTIDMMTASGYPREMVLGDNFDVIGKTSGGSDATYWTDYLYTASSGEVVLFGGSSVRGSDCGLGSSASGDAFGYSSSAYGARLSFRGDISDYTLVTGAELNAANGVTE